jgi:hypothetical protein
VKDFNLRIIFSSEDGQGTEAQIEAIMDFGYAMVERGIWKDFWCSGSVCLADNHEDFGDVESCLFSFTVQDAG